MDASDVTPKRPPRPGRRAAVAADAARRKAPVSPSVPPSAPPTTKAAPETPLSPAGTGSPHPLLDPPPIPRQVITAPAPPQRRRTPHNLFTLDEVSTCLARLAAELDPMAPQMVEVTWANGGSRRLPAYQLHRIGDPEDVRTLALDWTYPDSSRVRGELVTRSRLPSLTLEGAGAARAALGACLDHLESLRPERARRRAFMAGAGGFDLDAVLGVMAVGFVGYIWLTSPEVHADLLDPDGWAGTAALCALQVLVFGWLMRKLHRAFAGTRLVRQPVAHRALLTPEFTAVVTLLSLVSATVLGILALLK